jgi:hypothetical protein
MYVKENRILFGAMAFMICIGSLIADVAAQEMSCTALSKRCQLLCVTGREAWGDGTFDRPWNAPNFVALTRGTSRGVTLSGSGNHHVDAVETGRNTLICHYYAHDSNPFKNGSVYGYCKQQATRRGCHR